MSRRSLALLLIASAWTIGCRSGDTTPKPSIGTATEDIRASMSVYASRPGEVRVRVSLERNNLNGDVIELSPRESLRARFAGRSQRLDLDSSAFDPIYATDFDSATTSGPVQILFHRADGSVVDDPVVTLRPDFGVTSPALGQSLRFTDDLLLEWSPAETGRVMRIWLDVGCTTEPGAARGRTFYIQVPDDGSEIYDLGQIPEATDPIIDRSRDCTLGLRFERISESTITPPYSIGSRMTATQTRSVSGMTVRF